MYNEMPVFDYEDIQLIPNKCIIKSRSEADTHVRLGDYTFKLPVVPANMQTIIDEDIAEKLGTVGLMQNLIRTRVDKFDIKDSFTLENVEKANINNKIVINP